MKSHPFIKYGEAVVRFKKNLGGSKPLTNSIIADVLEESLFDFRVEPHKGNVAGSKEVSYRFKSIEKGNPLSGIFLAPNVMASDKSAGNTWKAVSDLISKLRKSEVNSNETAQMSFMPISGEFLSFGSSGSIGRGKSSISIQDAGCAAITTLTRSKPALHYRKINESPVNTALIPDLPAEELKWFLKLWNELHQKENEIRLAGRREETISGNKVAVKLIRPLLFSGNFPGAPRSSVMCGLSLLASLGEAVKEVAENERALYYPMMDALATVPIYMVQYGNAKVFHFNHYVVEMAKQGALRSIIDSVYHTLLYNAGPRTSKNYEYQKFDLFYSRFLQLFSESAFQDFMSFRAEYPKQIIPLFVIYFTKQHSRTMEQIPKEVVESAREIGSWLNKQAYRKAVKELQENDRDKNKNKEYYADLDKIKAKFLVGIESLIFSAKEGHDIIGQLAVTVGRASNEDFPIESELFFKKVATGAISTRQAQNLLMAFSRVSTRETYKPSLATVDSENNGGSYELEDSEGTQE